MAIRDAASSTSSLRGPRLQLTQCPVCGDDLSGPQKTGQHFFEEHGPEDFGLSPIGERAPREEQLTRKILLRRH